MMAFLLFSNPCRKYFGDPCQKQIFDANSLIKTISKSYAKMGSWTEKVHDVITSLENLCSKDLQPSFYFQVVEHTCSLINFINIVRLNALSFF